MPCFHKTRRILTPTPPMARFDVKVLSRLIPITLLNFPCNLARQRRMVSKCSLHVKAVPSAKNAPSLSLLWKASFPFCSHPHCGTNCLLLWIPWAFALLFHWLHSIMLFLASCPIHLCLTRPLGPAEWGLGCLYSIASLLSFPRLPPAPGIHSVFVEELDCWALWILSQ